MSGYLPHDVEWTPEKVGRLWGFYGSSAAHAGLYFSAHSGAAIVDRVEREVGLAGQRLLDFGCGRGDLLAHLYARGIAAAGLEFDEASAAQSAGRFAGNALFQGVTVASTLPSSLPAGAFDRIFLVEVVEHLLDEQVAPTFAEIQRLLAPGGRVVATAPNAENLGAAQTRCPDCGGTFHMWQHQRSLDPGSLAALFEGAGFRTVSAEPVLWGRAPRLRRLRRLGTPYTPHLLYVGEPR